jgi:hypothetical protein
MPEAIGEMIVDHTGSLHVGVDYGRADEFESFLFQVLSDGVGEIGSGGNFVEGVEVIVDCAAIGKAPDVVVEGAELFPDCDKRPGIGDGSGDFQAVADNAGVFQKRGDFTVIIAGNGSKIKMIECVSEVLSFPQDGQPAQTCLKGFQNQEFKQFSVLMNRNTPFPVMVLNIRVIFQAPGTALSGVIHNILTKFTCSGVRFSVNLILQTVIFEINRMLTEMFYAGFF